jgi:hypothetical protein
MNRVFLLFIALILVGVAFGQLTVVYYTDTECKTQPIWVDPPIFNPFSADLNACVKSLGNYYSKTACASGSFSSSTYNIDDTTCAGTAISTITNNTATCIVMPSTISGVNSYRVSCISGQVMAFYFQDNACQIMAPNSIGASVPNPLTVNLNTCTKTAGGYNAKATACASGSFTSSSYRITDTTCAGTAIATTTEKTQTCIVLPSPVSGLKSYKVVTCSSANPAKSLQSALALFVAVTLIAYF